VSWRNVALKSLVRIKGLHTRVMRRLKSIFSTLNKGCLEHSRLTTSRLCYNGSCGKMEPRPGRKGLARSHMTPSLELPGSQILAFRRRAAALDQRLPRGQHALRRAAWAGLQDSMPRAALLSIHARMAGTEPASWEDPSLVQVWGPRFSAYVVA